jgi:hypothetical protein
MQSYFAAHDQYARNLTNYADSLERGTGYRSLTPPPVTPMPQATTAWSSGMYIPPNMVQPEFHTTGSLIKGMLGISPDPNQFTGAEIRRAAHRQMSRKPGDVFMGAMSAVPAVGGLMGDVAGMALGSAVAGPVGAVAGAFMGDALVNTALSPITAVTDRYKLSRQLQTEFESDPRFARMGLGTAQANRMAGTVEQLGSRKFMGGTGLGMERTMDVLSILKSTGQFDQAQSPEEIERLMKQGVKSAQNISRIIKVSVEEGAQLMGDLKNMGFFEMRDQVRQLESMAGAANMAGMGVGRMMQIAGTGVSIMGGPRGAGVATGIAGGLGFAASGGGRASALVGRLGGVEQATAGLMQQQRNIMTQTGFGTMASARFMMGGDFGGGLDVGRISASIGDDPTNIARLMNPFIREKAAAEMGPNALPRMLEDITQSLVTSGVLTQEQASDPAMLSMFTGMSPDQIEAARLTQRSDVQARGLQARLMSGAAVSNVERRGLTKYGGRLADFYGIGEEGGGYLSEGIVKPAARNLLGKGFADWTRGLNRDYARLMGTYGNVEAVGFTSFARDAESTSRITELALSKDRGNLDERTRELEEDIFGTPEDTAYMQELFGPEGDKQVREAYSRFAQAKSPKEKARARKFLQGALLNVAQSPSEIKRVSRLLEKMDVSGDALLEHFQTRGASEMKAGIDVSARDLRRLSGAGGGAAARRFGETFSFEDFQGLSERLSGLSTRERDEASQVSAWGAAAISAGGDPQKLREQYDLMMRDVMSFKEVEVQKDKRGKPGDDGLPADTVRIDNPSAIYISGSAAQIVQPDSKRNLTGLSSSELGAHTYHGKGPSGSEF